MRKVGHRVYLNKREKKLSERELRKEIAKAGYRVASRGTIFRAKKQGWFAPNYPESAKSRASVTYADGWVYLSTKERNMLPSELVVQFAISTTLARAAKRRGWFEVNRYNRDLVEIPRRRLSKKPPT